MEPSLQEAHPDPAAGAEVETADAPQQPISERSESCLAATKLQKVYRSYRTRRKLADSAVVAEELWWQLIDFARLNHSTISFFNKPETAVSRWNRVSLNASKVGQGLSQDARALMLAFQHWIEAVSLICFHTRFIFLVQKIDPRHRYGHNLHFYYDEWCGSQAGQPFFYWLDIGDGRDVDLKECPRSMLRKQSIKYLGPQEREHYEYVAVDGRLAHKQTGELLDTTNGSEGAKWIFVMSTTKRLYAGQKRKGIFHHSSFLAGGVTIAAGRFSAQEGILKNISAYSGHYRPNEENLDNFLDFLKENGVNLDEVQVRSSSNENYYDDAKQLQAEKVIDILTIPKPPQLVMPKELVKNKPTEETEGLDRASEVKATYKRTLSGGLHSPRAEVPKKAILERIKSKRESRSYQLGHQLSLKWCSGAGPRIGCVADYPLELRLQALEFVDLSPRVTTPSNSQRFFPCLSPGSNMSPTLAMSPTNMASTPPYTLRPTYSI